MMTIAELAERMVARALPHMEDGAARILRDDLDAGEFEVAAITALEGAPLAMDFSDVRNLGLLAASFETPDREIALRAIARHQARSAA